MKTGAIIRRIALFVSIAMISAFIFCVTFGYLFRKEVVGKLNVPEGDFIVTGLSNWPLGWNYVLYWKRPGELWAEYWVQGDEDRWKNVKVTIENGVLIINAMGIPYAFDTRTSMVPIRVYKGNPVLKDGADIAIDQYHPSWQYV